MVKEHLAELALDAGKAYFENQVDEKKLRGALLDYIEKAVKYLGSELDPIQSKVSGLPGNVIRAVPPEFPPAFPCSIKDGDEVCFDYILLRTEEILDDGTYLISNKEQDICFHFMFSINPKEPVKSSFNISINHPNNHERLKVAKFKRALSQNGDIHVFHSICISKIKITTVQICTTQFIADFSID